MKKRLLGVLLVTCVTFGLHAQKIMGYYPTYSEVTEIQWDHYTDLAYAFIEPNWNGTLEVNAASNQSDKYRQSHWESFRTGCTNNGVKCHISVGGADKSTTLANVAANSTYRATFVAEIVKFVAGDHPNNNVPLAGMDIDWEFPEQVGTKANHYTLLKDLRAALDTRGTQDGRYYELGIAVGGTTPNMPFNAANYHTDYFNPDVINYIDYCFQMNYDLGYMNYANNHHSSLKGMTDAFSYYVNTLKWPANKILMGIPFYGRGSSNTNSTENYVNFASSAAYNDADGVYNGWTYNSKPVIEDKVAHLCSNQAGGVLIWEVTSDSKNSSLSLGKVIKDAFDNSCESLACSQPALGNDKSICEDPVTLSAGVTLQSDESIKWYKNGSVIGGATSSTYSATEAATYKAEITTNQGCKKTDEIVVKQSGDIQATPTNSGKFCASGTTKSVTINVTGGGGFYNFYDSKEGSSVISSGESLVVDKDLISEGSSKTFYVEEAAGSVTTLGLSEKPTKKSSWANLTEDLGWNNHNQVFSTYSTVTLKSIDFLFGYIGDQEHTLSIKILKYGTSEIVYNKTFTYPDYGSANWSAMNTVVLDVELPKGQYELATIGSKMLIWQTVNDSGDDLDYNSWSEPGVASLDGAISPDNPSWGVYKNANQGTFNWKFSTGEEGSAACGRVPVFVEHESCDNNDGSDNGDGNSGDNGDGNNGENTVENIITQTLAIYPNPAHDNLNVSFEMKSADNVYLNIYNAVGVLVNSAKLSNTVGDQFVSFDTSVMSGGLYFIKVQTSTGSITKTISIVK